MRTVLAGLGRVGLAGVAVGILGASLGGCVISPPPVVVAGHDANGALVVGGASCDDGFGIDTLRVLGDVDGGGRRTVWAITISADEATTAPPRAGEQPIASPATPIPPQPDPRHLGGITLIAVGDPTPLGWTTSRPLVGALPSAGRVVAEVFDSTGLADRAAVEVSIRGRPNRFTARVDEEDVATRAGPAATSRAIREACAGPPFDDGAFLLILAPVGVGLLAAAGGIGWTVARQYRRAAASTPT